MNDATKNLALFGLPITVTFELTDEEVRQLAAPKSAAGGPTFPPRTEDLTVRHMRIAGYEAAARALDAQDEVGFTAVALGRERAWVESLTPESYDALAQVVQEVNQTGFFAYFGRRLGRRAATDAARSQGEASLRSALAGK